MRISKTLPVLALLTLAVGCRERDSDPHVVNVTVMPPLTVEGVTTAVGPRADAERVGTTTTTGADIAPAPSPAAPVASPAAPSTAALGADARGDAGTRFEPSERYGIIEAPDLAKNLGLAEGAGAGAGTGAGAAAGTGAGASTPSSGTPAGTATSAPTAAPTSEPPRRPSAADPTPWTGSSTTMR